MVARIGSAHRGVRSVVSLLVALLMIGGIAYTGLRTFQSSHAASGSSLYATPASAAVHTGDMLSVSIREDSGSQAVNSVQAVVNYDSELLQFTGLTEGGAFPLIAATSTDTSGVVRVGRAITSAPLTGDQAVVTLNFKAIGTGGTGVVTVVRPASALVRASDSKDILQNVSGGSYQIQPTSPSTAGTAAVRPTFSLAPASGTVGVGSVVSVAVRMQSPVTAVTTVEAVVNYPANLLEYTGIAEGGVFTTQQRTKSGSGVVDVIRGVPGGGTGAVGDQPIVTLRFKSLTDAGIATLVFANTSAAFDNSGSGQNILDIAKSAGASYVMGASGSSTPTPSPEPSSTDGADATTSITSPAQALTISSQSGDGSAAMVTDADGVTLTELNGEVELAPIFASDVFADGSKKSVTKVEYYLDGKLLDTKKSAPYTYKFDTEALRNGVYTVVVKTYFSDGTTDTRTDKLRINNKVTLAYVVRHYLASMLSVTIMLSLLLLLMWKLVVPRFGSRQLVPVMADPDMNYRPEPVPPAATSLVADEPLILTPDGTDVTPTPPVDLSSTAAWETGALPIEPVAAPATSIAPTPAAPVPTVAPAAVPTTPTPPTTAPAAPAATAFAPAAPAAPVTPAQPARTISIPVIEAQPTPPAPATVIAPISDQN